MLKNYQYFQKKQNFVYKSFMATLSFLLLLGISVSPISWREDPIKMTIQVILISCILLSLFLFIFKDKPFFKTMFIIFITLYFYDKFWTFPDTAIMLTWLALIPLFPIFLYDKIAFYIVSTLNLFLGPFFINIIAFTDLQYTYEYVALDNFGNTLNFVGIQIILIFVFLATDARMDSTKAFHKEFQQAKQVNSIGQLAATIAHEIRNPITVVKGFAQLLHQEKDLNETEKYYVQTMLTELEYTQIIINDYLSLAKPSTDNIEIVYLKKEIQTITDLLSSFANNQSIGIHLTIKDEPIVKMNPIELKQVLVNIIKNGIESMHNAGYISVEVEQIGDFALIKIVDTGIGMSSEIVSNLGTPFYSLKEKGTGIGLTICFSIVQKYKGEIKVDSELNKGTTFSIYLPIHTQN